MTKLKDIMWRIAIAHKIHEIYCSKTGSAYCVGRVYDIFGIYVCSVDRNTFLRYLRTEVPAAYVLPPWIVDGLNSMVLSHMKYPMPLTEDEALEFMAECKAREIL